MKEDGLYMETEVKRKISLERPSFMRTKNTWLKTRYKKLTIIKHFHPCSSGQNININNC